MAGFDRIMLAQRTCQSRTTRRLDDAEFRAFIAALCLAGQSPVRGRLLISDGEPCTAEDIADEAGVEEAVAKSLVTKLLRLKTLQREDDGCLVFVNWSKFNPPPRKSETRDAWRERKQRQRERERRDRDEGSHLELVEEKPL